MPIIKTPIIPVETTFAKEQQPHELDLEAICVFAAIGFFLDTDTYWKDEVVLQPGSEYELDDSSNVLNSRNWFNWHYSPRKISFEDAVEEFSHLFESIINEQTKDKNVILPLSGGLDSRTQAVALRSRSDVNAYSYSFSGGFPEYKIAKRIAEKCNFPFRSFKVQKGYLWNCIEELAEINKCYSEFTHPRQMAFINEFKDLGDVFSLGHMGDLMFDSFNLPQLTFEEEVKIIAKLLLKKGGLELADRLWIAWGLSGTFESHFLDRIRQLLNKIEIENTNAKLRAFKTHYSVSRWTSNNLSVFEKVAPVTLPYYDDRMCEFICTVPEKYLSGRKLQIEYIKQNTPELAKITWHGQKPFNLYNYQLNKTPYNLPYRIASKLKRQFNSTLGKHYVMRNWELQFMGAENDKHLKNWLIDSKLKDLIPQDVILGFYTDFKKKDQVYYSHPVSMLLTLALFQKKFNK